VRLSTEHSTAFLQRGHLLRIMNRYRITALEDVEVSVSEEQPATVMVHGVPRRVRRHGAPHWKPLIKGETCEVTGVHGIRGDLFEESRVVLPTAASPSVVVHEALTIEALPPLANALKPNHPNHQSKPSDENTLPHEEQRSPAHHAGCEASVEAPQSGTVARNPAATRSGMRAPRRRDSQALLVTSHSTLLERSFLMLMSLLSSRFGRVGVVAAASGCLFLWAASDDPKGPQVKSDTTPLSAKPEALAGFAPIVRKVSPSVVNIYTAKTVRENARLSMEDMMLRQFFGFGYQTVPRERREQSLGSGVIVSEDGYILTNNHVVEAADEIRVALSDDKTIYDARVVGTDPQTDVAVIKVEAKNLPAITVTDSDALNVGDIVIALGNPFGVGQTVTMGIVSAKGRGGMGIVDYEDFIQTDASINPGNSGGALVDGAGRLVGINSAILSKSGGSQGIGFAIPINLAQSVMRRLVAEGRVSRGYLGATLQPLSSELAESFKLPDASGALVADVAPRSPAAQAGLKEGDVVVEFNGKKVSDSRQLRLLGADTAPGVQVPLKVLRDGKELSLSLRLAESPREGLGRAPSRSAPPTRPATGGSPLEGLVINDIDGRTRRQLNFPPQLQGVLITEVDPISPAAIAGLRSGDVILEIERRTIADTQEAVEQAREIKGDRALLRVWSNGGSHYVVVNSPRRS
jgi:serine protease Do